MYLPCSSNRCFHFVLAAAVVVGTLSSVPAARAQTSAGGLDASFGAGPVSSRLIDTVVPQRDGKVLIGGISFSSLNGVPVGNIARVNADGTLDTTFTRPNLESYDTRTDDIVTAIDSDYRPVVATILPQADGKIVVGGNFYFVNGAPGSGGLARFNADGSVDTTFIPPRFAGTVYAIAPAGNGTYIVAGDFSTVGSSAISGVVRLKANGTLDTSFQAVRFSQVLAPATTTVTPAGVRTLGLQGDGKIVIGGTFADINGVAAPGLARLNSDGTLDSTYQVDTRFNALGSVRSPVVAVYSLVIQGDGKAIVGGERVDPDDALRVREINALFRFNTDGSLDATFNPGGVGTNDVVDTVILQPDGKILIGGFFGLYNGTRRTAYARLLADGTLDTSFDSSQGTNDEVFSLALQGDGKLLLGGFFTAVDGVPIQFVARVNTQAGIPPEYTVGVTAGTDRALLAMPVTKGLFRFTRSGGNIAIPLNIPYALSGSAEKGTDYKVSGTSPNTLGFFSTLGTITIPANSTTATLKVKPLFGSVPVRKRNVVLTLTAPTNVLAVDSGTATIKIVNKSVE